MKIHRHLTRRPWVPAFAAALSAAVAGAFTAGLADAAVLDEERVKASVRQERFPAATTAPDGSGVWLAWTQTARARPGRAALLLETPAGVRRINPNGTSAYPGGFDGGTLVYQEVRSWSSDIRLYDVATAQRAAPPSGVNTGAWEWDPSRSGRWLAFGRDFDDGRQQVVLYDLETGAQEVLARHKNRRRSLIVNVDANADRVAWSRCLARCDVLVRDLATGSTQVLPRPSARTQQWGAAVTSDGTVYALRSDPGCGANTRIVRFGPGDPPTGTVVASLPQGVDAWELSPLVQPDGSVVLYYDRLVCRTDRWDIYRVADAVPAATP